MENYILPLSEEEWRINNADCFCACVCGVHKHEEVIDLLLKQIVNSEVSRLHCGATVMLTITHSLS